MILDIESRFNDLRISYFDDDGNVKVNDYKVEDVKNWTVCSETDKNKDPKFRNWDGKPVKKTNAKYCFVKLSFI